MPGWNTRGKNVGTEIATEELCRKLTGYKGPEVTDSVRIRCGTAGAQMTYTKNKVTVTVPSYYYKVIRYRDHKTGQQVHLCYWLPNQPTEKQAILPDRLVGHETLVPALGFDPEKVLN